VMDEIAAFSKPVIHPHRRRASPPIRYLRPGSHGTAKGLRMVMATNGTLITDKTIEEMKGSGIQRVSISLDGPDAKTHDAFRKVSGSFEGSLRESIC